MSHFFKKKCDMISARIKEGRTALKLSQPEASAKSGIPVGTLRKYEQGPSQPGAEAMQGFVRLGINANWLLTGEGPMLLAELQAQSANGPGMDRDRLRRAVKAMEKGLSAGSITMPPGKKAELVLAVYDMLEEPGVTEAKVINLVRAAAASLYLE